jgi:hypothetical protein
METKSEFPASRRVGCSIGEINLISAIESCSLAFRVLLSGGTAFLGEWPVSFVLLGVRASVSKLD